MNKKLIPLILASSILLVACDQNRTTAANGNVVVSKEDAIADVNGVYISKASLATLEAEIAQRSRGQSFPKEQMIEELIQRELLVQDAVQKQLDKTPEFTERLSTVKKSLLSQAAIQNYLKSNVITDAELEAEYNKNVGQAGTEYKARHILVKTEDEAKLIIVELDKGGDFVELAKVKSTGPSGPQGGDLGWFTADQMVGPFSEATIALKDGKYTTAPVQTKFGWHIILKEGARAQTPPPFESVKEQIRPALQRQKMQEFLSSLRSQAKVEILLEEPAAPEKAVAPEATPAETTEASDDKATEIVVEEVKTETPEKTIQVEEVVVDETKKAAEEQLKK
jgi:peptidyl-prolyl cis-trans isomerase C